MRRVNFGGCLCCMNTGDEGVEVDLQKVGVKDARGGKMLLISALVQSKAGVSLIGKAVWNTLLGWLLIIVNIIKAKKHTDPL